VGDSESDENLASTHPIPGIAIIVAKNPELNTSLYRSSVMLLIEMLKAGCSQAEVIEFSWRRG